MTLTIVITLVLLILGLLVYASACINSGFYLKARCELNTTEKVLALTFDDGPDPALTPRILDTLAGHNIKAIFFCIGNKIENNESIMQRIVAEGHMLGIHSYEHTCNFPIFPRTKMRIDLEKCASEIKRATGIETKLFRPPFGVTNPTIAKVVRKSGYTTVGWSIRSFDTSWKPSRVIVRITKDLAPGAIILLHDTTENITNILEEVIRHAHRNEYRFIRADRYF